MSHIRFRSLALVFLCLCLFALEARATPVRKLPGLSSISFWESSGPGTPAEHNYAVTGPELTARLSTLDQTKFDFQGVPTEYYDVFYSDSNGTFSLDGEYLTIEGVYGNQAPAGGGLNLAEIGLKFTGTQQPEFGNYVASSVELGNNARPDSPPLSIDGDLSTSTSMGNTATEPNRRLRVTLGFYSSSGPAPCSVSSARCCLRPGACCVRDACVQISERSCKALGGMFFGESSSCSIGACWSGRTCVLIPDSECQKLKGKYQGDQSKCGEQSGEVSHDNPSTQ